MSLPYTYPQFFYQTLYLYSFHNQLIITPFVPPCALPPSPHSDSGGWRVRFEDEDQYPQTHPRPPSWHAGMPSSAPLPNPTPFPSPPMMYVSLPVPFAGPPPSYAPHRRRSNGAVPGMHPGWVPVPWVPHPCTQYPTPLPSQFHPLLNDESQSPLLFFDLSIHAFNPVKVTSSGHTTGKSLSLEELQQQATHPGVTRMIIACDAIPQWPITLEPVDANSNFLSVHRGLDNQPITFGDVLVAIHRHLRTQIAHRDWVKLTNDEATQIARAYTRCCRTFPSVEQFEAS